MLRWLESPTIRLIEIDGEWTCPVNGATRHLASAVVEPAPFDASVETRRERSRLGSRP